MNKWLRFALRIALVFAGVLLAAHFTLRHSLNTPRFKAAATGFAERHFRRQANYDRIDYSLFPFSLVVRNASLREPDGSADFASIREFSVAVDWRTKEVSSVRLVEPVLRVVRRPDGSFNYSDLLPSPPPPDSPAPSSSPAPPASTGSSDGAPSASVKPSAPPVALRLLQIEKARFVFSAEDPDGGSSSLVLSNLNLSLQNLAADAPLHADGRANLGPDSSFEFRLEGAPLSDFARDPARWSFGFNAQLDVRSFSDLRPFLPPDFPALAPFGVSLDVSGNLSDSLAVRLRALSPASLDASIDAELSIPSPLARHLLAGAPLPDSLRPPSPSCDVPPGAAVLRDLPALVLANLLASAKLSAPAVSFGALRAENVSASLFVRDGILTVPDARLDLCGGRVEARANARLLECPLSYRLDRLSADRIDLSQFLDACGWSFPHRLSGLLRLQASLSGHAVAEPGLRSLEADASVQIDGLQSVGPGGSPADHALCRLDDPLLLKLLPKLRPKVETAKASASQISTTRYDEASASVSLRNGLASVSDARLAMPGYRLLLSGTLLPFDDRLDLAARVVASPEESSRLSDGKDLSAFLPYENGGLAIPASIRGSIAKPTVLPDLDALLQNALAGDGLARELSPHLDNLSESDKKHVRQGLQLLQNLAPLLK